MFPAPRRGRASHRRDGRASRSARRARPRRGRGLRLLRGPRRASTFASTLRQMIWVTMIFGRAGVGRHRESCPASSRLPLGIHRLGEHRERGRQQPPVAHRGELLDARAQWDLGQRRPASEHPDERLVMRHPPLLPSWSSVSLASSRKLVRSSNRPCIACSDASGLTISAAATGLGATSSRNPSQRRIASSTGVGPSTAAVARRPTIPNSSRSSPARRAQSAASLQALSAPSARPAIQDACARSYQARHRPWSSPSRSSTAITSSTVRRAFAVPALASVSRRTNSRSSRARARAAPRARARSPRRGRGHGLGDAARLEQRCPERAAARRAPLHRSPISVVARSNSVLAAAGSSRWAARSPAAPRCARRPRGERRRRLVGLAELAAQLHRALDVVSEELVHDHRIGRRACLQPVREALVQSGAHLLRHPSRTRHRVSVDGGSGTSPHPLPWAGSGPCGRARAGAAPCRSLEPSPTSAATRSRVNSFPSTDAASMTARSTGSRRSSRAASSAWIVGGTAIAVSSERRPDSLPVEDAVVGEHRDDLLDEERVAIGHRRGCASRRDRRAARCRAGGAGGRRPPRRPAARGGPRTRSVGPRPTPAGRRAGRAGP